MALDFPASPTAGQTYISAGTQWVWDGAKWVTGTTANAWAPIASPAFSGNPTAPTPPMGDNDTSIATTAFVAPAFNGIGRNLIHNPLFNIAQRGTGPWASGYTADRWGIAAVGAGSSMTTTLPVTDRCGSRRRLSDEAARSYPQLQYDWFGGRR